MKLTLKEKIIYSLIFLVIIIPFCFYAYATFFSSSDVTNVVIKQDGKIIKTLPLGEDTEFLVISKLGQNRVTIKNNSVRVTYANCPDKVCAKTTPLTKNNASTSVIVCLPHKLIISLEK